MKVWIVVIVAAAILIAANLLDCRAALAFYGNPTKGQHGWVSADWWICRSYEDFQKSGRLSNEDMMAEVKFLRRNCTPVHEHTEVVIEDTNWLHTEVCVRPVGEPDCGWVEKRFVLSAAPVR